MTIYHGNNKITDLYYNGNKIKEAYYGSDKVYPSGIPVWRFVDKYNDYNYLIGEYSTNGLVVYNASDNITQASITDISGTIGSQSSNIWTTNGNINTPYSLLASKVVAGNSYFLYFSNAGMVGDGQWVLSDYNIGDKCIMNLYSIVISVTSITDSTIVVNINGSSYTCQRDTNYFGILTKQGVIQQ